MTTKIFWRYFLLAWVIAGIPIFLLHGVPGVDTPNHVARLHVLASLHQNHALWSFYRPHWAILPNLAVDLFITPIVYFCNVNALVMMKIFLFNSIGVTGAGFALTNRAINAKWSLWGLFGLLFSYSYVLGFGFINYLFGIGLALLFIGVQLSLKDRPKLRLFVIATGFPILLLNHLLALVLGAMALIIIAIWQRDKCRFLWSGFALGSFFSLIYMKLSATVGLGGAHMFYDSMPEHLRNVFFPLYFSNLARDLAFWLVIVGVVIWLVAKPRNSASKTLSQTDEKQSGVESSLDSLPDRRDAERPNVARALPEKRSFQERGLILWKPSLALTMLIVFTLVALALPHMAMTSAYISGRISIWAILIAGAAVERLSLSPTLIFTLLFARSADISQRFLTWNTTFDQLKRDLHVVEDGSLVYQMTSMEAHPLEPDGWNPSIIHADCLLLLERNCYVNNLFSLPYQQPLQNSPEIGFDMRDLYNRGGPDGIKLNLQWIIWQIGMMSPRLQERSVYIFYVKGEQERPNPILGDVLFNRPRYTIYQLK